MPPQALNRAALVTLIIAAIIAAAVARPTLATRDVHQVSFLPNWESVIQRALAKRIPPRTLEQLVNQRYLLEIPLDPPAVPDWNRVVWPGLVIDDRLQPGIFDPPSPYAHW